MPPTAPRLRAGRAISTAAAVAAGLTLSGCGFLPVVLFDPGADSPYRLEVGDCLLTEFTDDEVDRVNTVDCTDPHRAEVYAITTLDDGDFPGLAKVKETAEDICREEFLWFVNVDYDDSELEFSLLHPSEQSWNVFNDRQVTCVIIDPRGTTGSLKGANR
ncbi:septum formation family protein [Nocardiopsis mwathae]|nr:septum formation family protein [Nocardiopsis mwathae]